MLRGISPPDALLLGIFLMIFLASLTVTGFTENFSCIACLL